MIVLFVKLISRFLKRRPAGTKEKPTSQKKKKRNVFIPLIHPVCFSPKVSLFFDFPFSPFTDSVNMWRLAYRDKILFGSDSPLFTLFFSLVTRMFDVFPCCLKGPFAQAIFDASRDFCAITNRLSFLNNLCEVLKYYYSTPEPLFS